MIHAIETRRMGFCVNCPTNVKLQNCDFLNFKVQWEDEYGEKFSGRLIYRATKNVYAKFNSKGRPTTQWLNLYDRKDSEPHFRKQVQSLIDSTQDKMEAAQNSGNQGKPSSKQKKVIKSPLQNFVFHNCVCVRVCFCQNCVYACVYFCV